MTDPNLHHVFLSYNEENKDLVESLARRLQGDARLSFWFRPWHGVPGVPVQEQMEDALEAAEACAVFIGAEEIKGWQNEQMRVAIQTRIEDQADYRIIPVLVPGANRPRKRDLPPFLRRYEIIEFRTPDDEHAFKRLLAGILGIPPVRVEGYIQTQRRVEHLPSSPTGTFEQGHALIIGISDYHRVRSLPKTVLNDACDLFTLLTDPHTCGYHPDRVALLINNEAAADAIRMALADLAARAGPDDTAVVFFSGHGAHDLDRLSSKPKIQSAEPRQYILAFDSDPADLPDTAISGDEMTALLRDIQAGRLLVLFDCCHSGGAGDPKGPLPQLKTGLTERYYQSLAQGKGRVVIASSRSNEVSWALEGMRNSLFTHFLIEALRGQCKSLGDGYVRVFDVFRHVADHVPTRANQHPVFKATAMEEDFPIALTRARPNGH